MTHKEEKAARRLCTHTVVFTEHADAFAVFRALQGRTTKSIARELGITESQAQYRVAKAQKHLGTYFRANYRNGNGLVVQSMLAATEKIGIRYVRDRVASHFRKFAAPGVPR